MRNYWGKDNNQRNSFPSFLISQRILTTSVFVNGSVKRLLYRIVSATKRLYPQNVNATKRLYSGCRRNETPTYRISTPRKLTKCLRNETSTTSMFMFLIVYSQNTVTTQWNVCGTTTLRRPTLRKTTPHRMSKLKKVY